MLQSAFDVGYLFGIWFDLLTKIVDTLGEFGVASARVVGAAFEVRPALAELSEFGLKFPFVPASLFARLDVLGEFLDTLSAGFDRRGPALDTFGEVVEPLGY